MVCPGRLDPMVSLHLARPPVEGQGSPVNVVRMLPAAAQSLAFTREDAATGRTGRKQSLRWV